MTIRHEQVIKQAFPLKKYRLRIFAIMMESERTDRTADCVSKWKRTTASKKNGDWYRRAASHARVLIYMCIPPVGNPCSKFKLSLKFNTENSGLIFVFAFNLHSIEFPLLNSDSFYWRGWNFDYQQQMVISRELWHSSCQALQESQQI